jgi:large subunit ribosomal protein L10
MVRQDKADKVKQLEELFSSANALVLAEYRGLTVTEQTKLRRELKNAGASFNVVKMSLAKRAAENIGYDSILEHFSGPTGVAVIESDPVEAAKVLKQFSKDNDAFVVKGGLMESEPLTIGQINTLASIDTRDVLLAKIAGGFNAPLTKMALGLKGVLSKSGYAFKALLDIKEANPGTSSEAKESDSSSEDSEDVIKEEE